MAFNAMYHGSCGYCMDEIEPGDEVTYGIEGDLLHEDCHRCLVDDMAVSKVWNMLDIIEIGGK